MIWLIQNAMFGDEFGIDQFTAAIDFAGERRIQLDYVFWESTIDLKLTGVTDPNEIIPFGTRSFTAYGLKNGWKVFWDRKYEYTTLLKLGEEFINYDMSIAPLTSLKVPDTGKAYIREAAGFNIIKGKVISGYSWPEWVAGFTRQTEVPQSHHDWHPIDGNSLFIYAPVKTIMAEYRVWIINNRVISSSQYMNAGVVEYRNTDNQGDVNQYAQAIADRHLFDMDTYVLDIFRTEKGLKVGEVNCVHCSGWYHVDPRKVVEGIVGRKLF